MMLDSNLRKNHASLAGISISSLTVVCAIIEEGSVTRAAKRLNLSQPAASQALKHLRIVFKDPLVKRRNGNLIPTERAIAIHAIASRVLKEIATLTISPESFEPQTLSESFVIGVQNGVAPGLVQTAISELNRLAPASRVTVQHLEPDFDFTRALSTNMMDVAIGEWTAASPHLRTMLVFEDDMVCMMDANNPLGDHPLSQSDYQEARHLIVSERKSLVRDADECPQQATNPVTDRNVMTDNHFYAPFMLQNSDLVLTAARRFARYFAEILPLKITECPVRNPRVRVYQIWHHRNEHTLSQRWLRNVIAGAV
ncbi:LysR family transcriptional regulator [Rhizobium sp. RU35A]|uniref:LysR family transcriptional regulator n=1 Tax=Rhizobium sp. RU35A TaxID=1907414 RepID=UPI001FCE61E6|nr:LysR family transcriptional regulator [Rhizobium sp. RU35A]